MNIIDAVKSGKRFRFRSGYWLDIEDLKRDRLPFDIVISEDWEIEEEKIEITEKQLEEAWKRSRDIMGPDFHDMKKYLGFKSEAES